MICLFCQEHIVTEADRNPIFVHIQTLVKGQTLVSTDCPSHGAAFTVNFNINVIVSVRKHHCYIKGTVVNAA